jgi:hypothetical protein
MKLKASTVTLGASVIAAGAIAGCGSSGPPGSAAAASNASSAIQRLAAVTPAVNVVDLSTGTDQHKIAATIQAFYRATWENHGSQACSLFSPSGASGFLQSARIAFPDSVNTTTSCPQAMAFYNADLADSVDTLRQAGVKASGTVLENVGVAHITVNGGTATAQAPENVGEFVAPKLFVLVRRDGRWYIEASRKIGQTLPQLLAAARKKGELVPRGARTAASVTH